MPPGVADVTGGALTFMDLPPLLSDARGRQLTGPVP